MSIKSFIKITPLYPALKWVRNRIPDQIFVTMQYIHRLHKIPNLRNPKDFNEKMCYFKLHNTEQRYSILCDKYAVREYVQSKIGEEYLIPLLGCWDSVDDILWDSLPNSFVLKPTHDSGSVIICKDKTKLDIEGVKRKLSRALRSNYYYVDRERPYKNIKPRIVAEKLLDEKIVDYKFYVFNGVPQYLYVGQGLVADHSLRISFYDMDGNLAPFKRMDYPGLDDNFVMPDNFGKMKDIASTLADDLPFVRVDLYSVSGKIYFSEITLTPAGGHMPFSPREYDRILGDMIHL